MTNEQPRGTVLIDRAPSTLSSNFITIDVTDDGRIEVTFDSHDGNTSWGESLSYGDSLYLAERLGGKYGFDAVAASRRISS
jgi:hypothetical protein